MNSSRMTGVSIQTTNSANQTNSSQSSSSVTVQTPKTTYKPGQCDSVNVDWTMYTSSVKDQGACNSCYAFASIGVL
jgi:C1A family cysteine protease